MSFRKLFTYLTSEHAMYPANYTRIGVSMLIGVSVYTQLEDATKHYINRPMKINDKTMQVASFNKMNLATAASASMLTFYAPYTCGALFFFSEYYNFLHILRAL